MDIKDFMDRFYEKIKIAAAHWDLGETEILVELVYDAHTDGFNEGCNYVKEQIEKILKEKECKNDQRR